MLFNIQSFKGMYPKINDSLLNDDVASKANNVDISNGSLKLYKTLEKQTTDLSYVPKRLYKYNDKWLYWTYDADITGNPLHNDKYGRVYISAENENSYPQVTCKQWINSSSKICLAPSTKPLGVPCPKAPTISGINYTVDGNSYTITDTSLFTSANKQKDYINSNTTIISDDTITDDLTHYYVITYVTEWGEESQPSSPVLCETIFSDWEITLSLPLDNTISPYKVNKIRIYRSVTSTEQAEFLYIGEALANSDVSFYDNSDNVGGTALATENYDMPVKGLQGFVQMANGIIACYIGQKIYFSEAYIPYAFPQDYMLTTEDDIVGMASFGTYLIVCTKGIPYIFQGSTPSSMTSQRLPIQQACLSKRSVVALDNMVIYASPDGLVSINANGQAEIITSSMVSREQWLGMFKPETIEGSYYDGNYIFKANEKIYTLTTSGIIELTPNYNVSSFVWDIYSDSLYISSGINIYKWCAINNLNVKYSGKWVSKEIRTVNTSFTVCKIISDLLSDSGKYYFETLTKNELLNDLKVNFYCNDKKIYTKQILDNNIYLLDRAFRLPIVRGNKWRVEIEISGYNPNIEILGLQLAGSMQEITI